LRLSALAATRHTQRKAEKRGNTSLTSLVDDDVCISADM